MQVAEWILSHMLEISHARGPRGAPEGPQGQLEALGAFGGPWGPRVSQDDPLKPKKDTVF